MIEGIVVEHGSNTDSHQINNYFCFLQSKIAHSVLLGEINQQPGGFNFYCGGTMSDNNYTLFI